MVRRLHWGCGPITPYGWVNSDLYALPGVEAVADIRRGLPFPDESFDYAVNIHALPELSYRELDAALGELRRVVKVGGVIRFGLPDLEKAIRAYQTGDIDYFFLVPDEDIRSLTGKMIVQLLWYGQSRSMFTVDFMRELLERNQFRDVRSCSFGRTHSPYPGITELDNRESESFFMEATR